MSRIMQTAIPAAIIACVFVLAAPGESWAQCNQANGDCEAAELAIQIAKSCEEQTAKTGGGRDQTQVDRHAKIAEEYDLQAEKWEELAEAAHTPHLEHAYRNEARGLRALADAEREKLMVHVAAADALLADCDQQVASLNQVEEAGIDENASPAKVTQDAQPTPPKASPKKKRAKAVKPTKKKRAKAVNRTKKKVVVRKRSRGKRVRLVRRARPRVVIGVGIGFGGIGIGF